MKPPPLTANSPSTSAARPPQRLPQLTAPLNWLEWQHLVRFLAPQLQNSWIERIFIPERRYFHPHFLKKEWALQVRSPQKTSELRVSLRPPHPSLGWSEHKESQAATTATHSGFDLLLHKTLKKARILDLTAVPQDRILVLWCLQPHQPERVFGLVLIFIPSRPEALLFQTPLTSKLRACLTASQPQSPGDAAYPTNTHTPPLAPETWQILGSTRRNLHPEQPHPLLLLLSPPQASSTPARQPAASAPQNPLVRELIAHHPHHYFRWLEGSLKREAFAQRIKVLEKALLQSLKQEQERITLLTQRLQSAEQEPDWQAQAHELKAQLASFFNDSQDPSHTDDDANHHSDASTDATANALKAKLSQAMSQAYDKAKRKKRRLEETRFRLTHAHTEAARLQATLSQIGLLLPADELPQLLSPGSPQAGATAISSLSAQPHAPATLDWEGLGRLERENFLISPSTQSSLATAGKGSHKTTTAAWSGKSFRSAEGLPIWVGRSSEENLELTFQAAKGNDLWFHVRGKPGAHVVIALHTQGSKKTSASLSSLLDAAQLALYYSGGEHWGKTEVDYTHRKYVKKIKKSKEVSYSQNKTLICSCDPTRMKELLGEKTPPSRGMSSPDLKLLPKKKTHPPAL